MAVEIPDSPAKLEGIESSSRCVGARDDGPDHQFSPRHGLLGILANSYLLRAAAMRFQRGIGNKSPAT
jgi:hypothetical protein